MTAQILQIDKNNYQLTITKDNDVLSNAFEKSEIRELIQTLDNAIL